jgi:uncharacterized membrane protein
MQNSITKTINKIKRLFLSGLFTILPIVLTIAVFTFTFRVLKNWLHPLYYITPNFLKALPLSEFIFVFFAILAIGAILKFFLLRSLLDWVESLFGKIPLVRQIYFGIKQLIYAFSPREEEAFQKIVLVEFPRKNIYSLGFLTGQCPIELHPKKNETYYNFSNYSCTSCFMWK